MVDAVTSQTSVTDKYVIIIIIIIIIIIVIVIVNVFYLRQSS